MQSLDSVHPVANANHYCFAQNQRANMLNCSNKSNKFQQKMMARCSLDQTLTRTSGTRERQLTEPTVQ